MSHTFINSSAFGPCSNHPPERLQTMINYISTIRMSASLTSSRRTLRRVLLVQICALFVAAGLLVTQWARAEVPSERCERRALANDVAGQYVVTCEGTLPMVRTFPARRANVRTVMGSTTVHTYGATRVGVTTVTHMGVRG